MKSMTHQQILEKAIQQAIDGGWKPVDGIAAHYLKFDINEAVTRVLWRYGDLQAIVESSVYGVLFTHDFAKALWGEELWDTPQGYQDHILAPKWQIMLQQMVIADDPLVYLSQHI